MGGRLRFKTDVEKLAKDSSQLAPAQKGEGVLKSILLIWPIGCTGRTCSLVVREVQDAAGFVISGVEIPS